MIKMFFDRFIVKWLEDVPDLIFFDKQVNGVDQLFLGGVIIIDRAHAGIGLPGNGRHRGGLHTVVRQQPHRGINDLFFLIHGTKIKELE